MSTEPVGLGNSDSAITAVESTREGWCSIEISKEMYCSYSGECPLHRVIQGDKICLWCVFRAPINLPEMIKRKLNDGKI